VPSTLTPSRPPRPRAAHYSYMPDEAGVCAAAGGVSEVL
jgi:hypothetical protein